MSFCLNESILRFPTSWNKKRHSIKKHVGSWRTPTSLSSNCSVFFLDISERRYICYGSFTLKLCHQTVFFRLTYCMNFKQRFSFYMTFLAIFPVLYHRVLSSLVIRLDICNLPDRWTDHLQTTQLDSSLVTRQSRTPFSDRCRLADTLVT